MSGDTSPLEMTEDDWHEFLNTSPETAALDCWMDDGRKAVAISPDGLPMCGQCFAFETPPDY